MNEKLEESFREVGSGSVRFVATREEVKEWIDEYFVEKKECVCHDVYEELFTKEELEKRVDKTLYTKQQILDIVDEWIEKGFEIDTLRDRIAIMDIDTEFKDKLK